MKLHLPKPLRNSVLACIAAVAGIATPTLGTATFAGGVVAFTLASQQAMADYVWKEGNLGNKTADDWKTSSNWETENKEAVTIPENSNGPLTKDGNMWEKVCLAGNGTAESLVFGSEESRIAFDGWDTNFDLSNGVTLYGSFTKFQSGSAMTVNIDNNSQFNALLSGSGNCGNTLNINVGAGSLFALTLDKGRGGNGINLNMNAADAAATIVGNSHSISNHLTVTTSVLESVEDNTWGTKDNLGLTITGVSNIDSILRFNVGEGWERTNIAINEDTYKVLGGKYYVDVDEAGKYSIVYSTAAFELNECVWNGGNLDWSSDGTVFSGGVEFYDSSSVIFKGDSRVNVSSNGVVVYGLSVVGEGTEVIINNEQTIQAIDGIYVGPDAALAIKQNKYEGKYYVGENGMLVLMDLISGWTTLDVDGYGQVVVNIATGNHDKDIKLGTEFHGTLTIQSGNLHLPNTQIGAGAILELVSGESWGGNSTFANDVLLSAASEESSFKFIGGAMVFAGKVSGNYLRNAGGDVTIQNSASDIEAITTSGGTSRLRAGHYDVVNANGGTTNLAGGVFDTVNANGGTVNINDPVYIGSSIILNGATVNVGANGKVSLANASQLVAGTGVDLTTNGLKNVQCTLLTGNGNGTTAAALSAALGTVSIGSSAYAITDGVVDVRNVYYAVEEGSRVTVGGDAATSGTGNATAFVVGNGATMVLAGNVSDTLTVDSMLAGGVLGSGTLEIATNACLHGKVSHFSEKTVFTGTWKVMNGATLSLGDDVENPGQQGWKVDLTSLEALELSGGNLFFSGGKSYISNVKVSENATLRMHDMNNDAADPLTITSLDIAEEKTLTLRYDWKGNIIVEALTGAGSLVNNAGGADGATRVLSLGITSGFTGSLDLAKGTNNLNLEKGATLSSAKVTVGSGATVNLSGAGTYDLGSPASTALPTGVTLTDNWTGAVRIGGVDNSYYPVKNSAGNNQNLECIDALTNGKGTVMLNGVSGWLAAAATPGEGETISANLQLKNLSDTVDALKIDNGYSWKVDNQIYAVFAGSISGDGNIRVDKALNLGFRFSGDISGWSGNLYSVAAGHTSYIVLEKAATQVNASIDRTYKGANGKINLTVNNQATFANKVNVTSLTLGENAGITLAKGSSLEVATGGTTIGAGQSLATTTADIVMNSALTFNGGSLTLGGALNLGGQTLTISTTNKTALTLADGIVGESFIAADLITNLSGIVGFTSGAKLGEVFSVADSLANLYLEYDEATDVLRLVSTIAEDRTWVEVEGAENGGTWKEGSPFGGTGAANFAKGDYAIFGALNANESVAIDAAGVKAGSVTIEAGEGKSYVFSGGALTTPKLTVTSGTAEFGNNTLQLAGLSSATVANGGVLDLSAYDVSEFQGVLSKTTGAGTLVLNEGQVMLTGDQSIDVNTQIDGDELRLNANNVGQNAVVTLNKALSYTDKTNSFLRLESGAKLLVADNGVLEVGKVELGHIDEAGNVGHLEIATGGTVTAGSVAIATDSDGGTLVMNGGTLELTGTEGIAAGISTTITAGTLVAKEASWGITGATIGGWDAVNNAPKVTISGTQTITLTNAKLTSTLKNTGNLNLAGTINISNTEAAAFQTTKNGADWFSTTGDANGNGFRFATLDYTIATGTGIVTSADGLKWSLNGTKLTSAQCKLNLNTAVENSSDKVTILTVMGQRQDTLYWVNNNTVTYDGTTPADGETRATGYALNGGILQLNTTLTGLNIERKGIGTINLNGTGVTLSAAQLTGTGSATLTGNGVYDLGGHTKPTTVELKAITTDGEGIVTDGWCGTVVVSGDKAGFNLKDYGHAGSTIELKGLSNHFAAGHLVFDSDIKFTDVGDTKALILRDEYSVNGQQNKSSYTFTGNISGSGTWASTGTKTPTQLYVFAGNVKDWNGSFEQGATFDTDLKFTGSNAINVAITRNAGTLDVFVDDATISGDVKTVAVNNTITASSLTLGLSDDAAADRASVVLNNNVTVDTLTNYAATTLGAAHTVTDADGNTKSVANNLTVGTLTNAGTLTVNGALAAGAAVTNNGTLKLTQDAASLASLANAGTLEVKDATMVSGEGDDAITTYKDLTVTGGISGVTTGEDDAAVTTLGSIKGGNLILQGASNELAKLELAGSLTLGVDAVKNADGVITTAGVASTLVTTGQLSVTGDVKVLTLGAGITETTGDVTTSYGMLKAASLAGKLNFVIAEDELTRYMGTSNTLTLATITGLTTTKDVSLNKVDGSSQWSDGAWTDSEGQYTYKLTVDPNGNGTLTLTRENLGIIWDGAKGEKWVMDSDAETGTKAWTNKDGTKEQAYTVAESVIFDGKGITDVIISGAVETKNVNINAEDVTYTFTGDAAKDGLDTLEIQNKLSVLKGTLKADAGLDVEATHSVEVLNGAAMELLSGASVHALAGISNAGTVTIGASSETQGAAALFVEYEGSVNNSGTMVVNGILQAGYGMGVAAKGLNINNSGTLTNAGMIKADGNLDNSGTYTQTAGSLTVYGNVLNTGSVTETTPAGGMNITDGYAVVGGNLTNSGAMSISGGAQTRVEDLYEEDCDNLEVGGNLVNTGIFTVSGEGTKVTVGGVDNDGTLSVAGGSMTVTGNLDNRNKGSIAVSGGNLDITDDAGETITTVNNLDVTGDLLNAGGTLSITGEGTKVAVGGNLQMQEASAEDDTLLKGTLTVGEKTSLTVGGNLAAADMKLGFEGSVTVGGTATLKDLTIAEGASFTAENATITGVLDNDGSLTVTTTEVEDDNGNVTYTGGQLSIGTLTGAGVVHVEEGGTLSIGSSVNFTGTLTGEGKLTTGNQAFTLSTKQDEVKDVALATDISAKSLVVAGQWMKDGEVVTEGTPGAKWASANGSILGEVATDSITFTKLDTTGNKHLTMESLQAYSTSTASGAAQVEVALSQLDTEEGVAELIKTGVHTYNLLSYVDGKVNFSLADMAYDREQQLWKSGLKLGEIESASTMALRASSTNVSISVLKQSLADATWNTAGETTGIGLDLGTLTNGTMVLAGNDMLDNVQSVNVTKDVTLDLSSTDTNAVNVNGLTGGKTLNIAGNGDVVNVSTVAGGFGGTLGLDNVQATVSGKLDTVKLTNKAVADLAVTNTDVEALTSGLTLNGSMKGGELSISKADGVKGTLKIDGTDLNIAYDDKGKLTMSTTGVAETGHVLVNMDKITGEAGDIFIGKGNEASKLMEKYFTNVRFEDKKGVVADRNTVYYTSKLADSASTDNGKAGLAMADEALLSYNPQNTNSTGDLAKVLEKLDEYVATGNKAGADELGASLAGASTAVLGMAAMGDVDRQLRAIRNRTTTMGVDQSVVNADMPYFNAWINAEGDSREMGEDETLGGYKLNSYGGTVGFDVDIEPTLTAGMALTAMYGDLDATGADKATGNLDSYYVSAFARYCGSAWTHTFVGTIGMGDISLDRTVGSAQVKGETDSMSFGLMYEVGRVYAMDEDGTTCLQPVFNVTWKHTTVDAYTEKGGDVALSVDEQSLNTITFGLGARLQTVVGESMYNRTSIFECRLLAKADAGDTEGTSKVALGSSATHEVKSNEMGAIGIEVGAGLTIPLGDEGSSIFMDASAEIRADYTDVNGTVGYRVNF